MTAIADETQILGVYNDLCKEEVNTSAGLRPHNFLLPYVATITRELVLEQWKAEAQLFNLYFPLFTDSPLTAVTGI